MTRRHRHLSVLYPVFLAFSALTTVAIVDRGYLALWEVARTSSSGPKC